MKRFIKILGIILAVVVVFSVEHFMSIQRHNITIGEKLSEEVVIDDETLNELITDDSSTELTPNNPIECLPPNLSLPSEDKVIIAEKNVYRRSLDEYIEEEFPSFPWPPPLPSASVNIPLSWLQSANTSTSFGVLDEKIITSLESVGYVEKSYFYVPQGFAIVTRVEQINSDGSPRESGRWSLEVSPLERFTIGEYLNRLFNANHGMYRVIVFIITPTPFSQSGHKINRDEAINWLNTGFNSLPPSISKKSILEDTRITALIYQFEKPQFSEAIFLSPSTITGADHLTKCGLLSLWQPLQ